MPNLPLISLSINKIKTCMILKKSYTPLYTLYTSYTLYTLYTPLYTKYNKLIINVFRCKIPP